jgi:Icc-related predicted phosphoesterase
MKIQIASDLHFEFHADRGREFIQSLDPTGVDVLVLAGDICPAKREFLDEVFGLLAPRYPHLLYVAGNHEYYGISARAGLKELERLSQSYPNVHFLNNSRIEIDGQGFVGTTGWFPENPSNWRNRVYMNDFLMIRDFEPWVYNQHHTADIFLCGASPDDIFVTHHLPTRACISPKYDGSALNDFFVSEFDHIVVCVKPRLWIHGHTHEQTDFVVGNTRIVANPLGYPREPSQERFKDKLVIDTDSL